MSLNVMYQRFSWTKQRKLPHIQIIPNCVHEETYINFCEPTTYFCSEYLIQPLHMLLLCCIWFWEYQRIYVPNLNLRLGKSPFLINLLVSRGQRGKGKEKFCETICYFSYFINSILALWVLATGSYFNDRICVYDNDYHYYQTKII